MNRFDLTRIHPDGSKEAIRMLLPEDMARIRQHDLLIEVRRDRLARQATAGRWWRRLARYAHQRADHAEGEITRP
ncbi:hypothetical protein OOZ19_24625 [Saccharopolyspora sp. NFXS83]|uniref:hypothetical protein n=1 Tax=Saccharopolyspora sp. NFXS83 TaxID=2993560 RepID=UPI00224B3B31|nr:hypothetical protein [Saccharopolyspora sp. NFXS83]MCX2733442.1 hypothetical protein [Saccharopolyspora sp. NFXS83]